MSNEIVLSSPVRSAIAGAAWRAPILDAPSIRETCHGVTRAEGAANCESPAAANTTAAAANHRSGAGARLGTGLVIR